MVSSRRDGDGSRKLRIELRFLKQTCTQCYPRFFEAPAIVDAYNIVAESCQAKLMHHSRVAGTPKIISDEVYQILSTIRTFADAKKVLDDIYDLEHRQAQFEPAATSCFWSCLSWFTKRPVNSVIGLSRKHRLELDAILDQRIDRGDFV